MASKQEATFKVVNMKDRSYNGYRKGQVAEVKKSELNEYLVSGFEIVPEAVEDEKPESPKAPTETTPKTGDIPPADEPKKLNRAELIAELTALGVEFKEVGTSNATLEALLVEAKAAA